MAEYDYIAHYTGSAGIKFSAYDPQLQAGLRRRYEVVACTLLDAGLGLQPLKEVALKAVKPKRHDAMRAQMLYEVKQTGGRLELAVGYGLKGSEDVPTWITWMLIDALGGVPVSNHAQAEEFWGEMHARKRALLEMPEPNPTPI